MSYHPESGHDGPGVFWTDGQLTIYRHCDRVFELLHDGNAVMPPGTFEQVVFYCGLEFPRWFNAHETEQP